MQFFLFLVFPFPRERQRSSSKVAEAHEQDIAADLASAPTGALSLQSRSTSPQAGLCRAWHACRPPCFSSLCFSQFFRGDGVAKTTTCAVPTTASIYGSAHTHTLTPIRRCCSVTNCSFAGMIWEAELGASRCSSRGLESPLPLEKRVWREAQRRPMSLIGNKSRS